MGEDFNWPWFIGNLWERENAQGLRGIEGKGGYRNGKYYPYTATNGTDVGPGFDMQFQSEAFKKKAAQGFTKQELDDSLKAVLDKEIPYIKQRIVKEGGNPANLTNEVLGGLLDIYHNRHNGLYTGFPNLWKAVAKGDYEGMQRESRTGYYVGSHKPENWHWDDSRWNYRKENYFRTPNSTAPVGAPVGIPAHVEQPDALRVTKPVIATPILRQKSEGGFLKPKDAWGSLSMQEKAAMIKVAVNNGITNMRDIRQKYNEFAEGGSIHIKDSKKGTFTAAATKHGKSVQEFASQVLSHPENYSPAMRRKANFARNASKWHGLGGPLVEQVDTDLSK